MPNRITFQKAQSLRFGVSADIYPICACASTGYVIGVGVHLLRASERSEQNEHTVVLSLRFLYIYIYSVTKILRKIRATAFTEKLRKITREGDERLG